MPNRNKCFVPIFPSGSSTPRSCGIDAPDPIQKHARVGCDLVKGKLDVYSHFGVITVAGSLLLHRQAGLNKVAFIREEDIACVYLGATKTRRRLVFPSPPSRMIRLWERMSSPINAAGP